MKTKTRNSFPLAICSRLFHFSVHSIKHNKRKRRKTENKIDFKPIFYFSLAHSISTRIVKVIRWASSFLFTIRKRFYFISLALAFCSPRDLWKVHFLAQTNVSSQRKKERKKKTIVDDMKFDWNTKREIHCSSSGHWSGFIQFVVHMRNEIDTSDHRSTSDVACALAVVLFFFVCFFFYLKLTFVVISFVSEFSHGLNEETRQAFRQRGHRTAVVRLFFVDCAISHSQLRLACRTWA